MAHFDYYLTADTKQAILDDLRAQGFDWYDTDDMGNPTGTRDPTPRTLATSIRFGTPSGNTCGHRR